MYKYKLTLSYDGTDYVGWQIQPNGTSIQGLVEEALNLLLKTQIRVMGAGRTDAGVHALAQTAHFTSENLLDCAVVIRALNGMLPNDIRILDLCAAPTTFHAQRSACGKEYHYHLWLGPTVSPFVRRFRHHICHSLDLNLLQEAAEQFVGTHDFATFANVGSSALTTIRTIRRLDVVAQEGGVRLEFEGNGFLYKMVRNLTGTLIEIASRKRNISDIPTLFEAKDRRAAGSAAPARGLFLANVYYNKASNEEMCKNSFPSS